MEAVLMARPLRIEYPGACYHVMSRGNARLPIFGDDADKKLLLDRMVRKTYRAKVTGYIHLNPVRIPSFADAPLDVRHREALEGLQNHPYITNYNQAVADLIRQITRPQWSKHVGL